MILCGGRGSRMGDLVNSIPKSLLEVHGKPILWYTFFALYKHGIRNFVLPLGHKGKMVEEYMRAVSHDMDCQILAMDTGEETSIAGRIHQIARLLPDNTDFLLLNSDTIFEFDIEAMYKMHKDNDALVTLSSVEIVSTWGLILFKDDQLSGFDRQRKVHYLISEDSPGMRGLVNSGIAWLNKAALDYINLETCDDFETSLYQRIIDEKRAAHFRINGYWFPIDTPKDLEVVNLTVEDSHSTGHAVKTVRDLLTSVRPNTTYPNQ